MKIKLLSPNAKVPVRADKGAAGYDLIVPEDTIIKQGRNIVPLNFSIELDKGTEAQIRPRSGFSAKGMEGYYYVEDKESKRFNADVLLGTIDESYRGNVGVIVNNHENLSFVVKANTRIAQMVISNYIEADFTVTDCLTETERGEGGFGHTGTGV